MDLGIPLETENLDEFFDWIRQQNLAIQKRQNQLSKLSASELESAFEQVSKLLQVDVATVKLIFNRMTKEHLDPTLPQLKDRVMEEESKRLESVMQQHANQLIKQVHKDTLVSKADILKVYESMLDVNSRLPTRETLALRVRDVYYNEYPHLRVKMSTKI